MNKENEVPEKDARKSPYGKALDEVAGFEQTAMNMTLDAVKDDTQFMRHDGLDAYLNLPEYISAIERSDDCLRRALNDDVRFGRIIARTADDRESNIASIKRISVKDGRQALVSQHLESLKDTVMSAVQADSLSSSADIVEQSSDSIDVHNSMNASLNEADRIAEETKRQISKGNTSAQTDEEKNKAIGGVDAATIAAKAAIGAAGSESVSKISERQKKQTLSQCDRIFALNKRVWESSFKLYTTCGLDRVSAYTKACEDAGSVMKLYFAERIRRGQPNQVVEILDEIERLSDEKFKESRISRDKDGNPVLDKDGKPVVGEGKYNPFNMLCCKHDDFGKLKDAAYEAVNRRLMRDKLDAAKKIEDWKARDAKIRIEANKLSQAAVLDMGMMGKLQESVDQLLAEGFTDADKTSDHLTSIIRSAERKYDKAQKDSAKLQTAEDFENEYLAYMDKLKSYAPIAWLAKTGRIDVGEGLHANYANRVDGQNRLILLIRSGQSRGLLKGDVWEKRLRDLEADRASEDYDAALDLMANIGIEVDVESSESLRTAIGGDVAKNTGKVFGDAALKSMWTKDGTGRLKLDNPKYMMYNWTDTETKRQVHLTGDELNQILGLVSEWQRRHVNPSPGGTYNKDLKEYVTGVLHDAARRKTIKHWFSRIERNVPFGFDDIERVGRDRMREYFAGEQRNKLGKKTYDAQSSYNRDMQILESAVIGGSLPAQSEILKAIRQSLDGRQ